MRPAVNFYYEKAGASALMATNGLAGCFLRQWQRPFARIRPEDYTERSPAQEKSAVYTLNESCSFYSLAKKKKAIFEKAVVVVLQS